jgi:prepilin-type N-terminal cleavage/methylation domain-containing protein/prepilin-type processing-associated H-X9-DG protein
MRHALSLIELLVVIAIISVLAGLLLPALFSVRRSARSAQCASSLRQLTIGLLAYADDNRERLPPSLIDQDLWYFGQQFSHSWGHKAILGGYLDFSSKTGSQDAMWDLTLSNNVFRCAGDSRGKDASGVYPISYGGNEALMPQLVNSYDLGKFTHDTYSDPSSTFLLGDANHQTIANSYDMLVTPTRDDLHLEWGRGKAVDPLRGPFKYECWTIARHPGANCSFVDGHVAKFADPGQALASSAIRVGP